MHLENVPPPPCPTCGKQMNPTGHSPACESVTYDFLCRDDGDRISWRRPLRVAANSGQNLLKASPSTPDHLSG